MQTPIKMYILSGSKQDIYSPNKPQETVDIFLRFN